MQKDPGKGSEGLSWSLEGAMKNDEFLGFPKILAKLRMHLQNYMSGALAKIRVCPQLSELKISPTGASARALSDVVAPTFTRTRRTI